MKGYETMYVKKLKGTNKLLKTIKKEQCNFFKQTIDDMDYLSVHPEWVDDILNENMDIYKVMDVHEMSNYDNDLDYLILPKHYSLEFMEYQLFAYEKVEIVE